MFLLNKTFSVPFQYRRIKFVILKYFGYTRYTNSSRLKTDGAVDHVGQTALAFASTQPFLDNIFKSLSQPASSQGKEIALNYSTNQMLSKRNKLFLVCPLFVIEPKTNTYLIKFNSSVNLFCLQHYLNTEN